MVSCCSIDPNRDFEVIIIGGNFLCVSISFHLCSYGVKTALVDQENLDERITLFFKKFTSLIAFDSGMPWSLEELKSDIHLILFHGNIIIKNNHVIQINEKEIKGKYVYTKGTNISDTEKVWGQGEITAKSIMNKIT